MSVGTRCPPHFMGGRKCGTRSYRESLGEFRLQLLTDAGGNCGGGRGGKKSKPFLSGCASFLGLTGGAVRACESEKKSWLPMMAHLHHALGALRGQLGIAKPCRHDNGQARRNRIKINAMGILLFSHSFQNGNPPLSPAPVFPVPGSAPVVAG